MDANPDKPCPHEDFEATVEVNRLTSTESGPVDAYSADIRVRCAQCDEPFRWIGVPAGMKPDRPMVSVDETELHAPMRPASADPDFGLGIPGFAIRVRLQAPLEREALVPSPGACSLQVRRHADGPVNC